MTLAQPDMPMLVWPVAGGALYFLPAAVPEQTIFSHRPRSFNWCVRWELSTPATRSISRPSIDP